jgi:hypothetical protein
MSYKLTKNNRKHLTERFRDNLGKGKVYRLGRGSFRVGVISIVVAEANPKSPRHFA